MVPENGDTVYPETEPIEYEYVPFGTENVIVFVVEDSVVPFSVIDHEVPDGRPDSVNVIEYFLMTCGDVEIILTVPEFQLTT